MAIRDTLNNNPAITTVGAVVVLVICLGLVVLQLTGGGSAGGGSDYYYDLNTGKIFVAEAAQAPIKAPSGPTDNGNPAGVRAIIYACGECGSYDGMDQQQIAENGGKLAYLVRMQNNQPQQQQGGDNGNQQRPPSPMFMQPLVSRPDKIQWVRETSQQAQSIVRSEPNCPEGQKVRICDPDR
jgi:hypothetical protein